jgi:hypothetical protein
MKIVLSLEIEVENNIHCSDCCSYIYNGICMLFRHKLQLDDYENNYFRCNECKEALVSEISQ